MSSGPSKEEFEMYWKSSRQYFDELAKYYKTSDTAYYNQYIAPFYSNPLYSIGTNKRSGSSSAVIIAGIVFLLIGLLSVGVFLFISMENEPSIKYEPQKIEKKVGKEIEKTTSDTIKSPAIETDPVKTVTERKK